MMAAPHTKNEIQRVKKLEQYNILDTLPEADYDNIVKLVSTICETPIALVSLIDSDRQWFKSKTGLEVDETHRDLAFCGHALLSPDELFIVENAAEDDRFHDNPLVTGDPHIRFYAGCPLVTDTGEALGTLCAIDKKPRSLSLIQQEALRILSKNVMAALELRKKNIESETLIKRLQDSNYELESFAHIASHDLKSPLRAIATLSEWTLEDDKNKLTQDSQRHLSQINKRSKRMSKILDDLLNYARIDFTQHNTKYTVLGNLLEDINDLIDVPQETKIKISPDLYSISIPHMPMSQVFLNLISNAIKHRDKDTLTITIEMKKEDQFYVFSVTDNGPGIPKAYHKKVFDMFQRIKTERELDSTGIGLALVRKIITRLGGRIMLDSKEKEGATFKIMYPEKYIKITPLEEAI